MRSQAGAWERVKERQPGNDRHRAGREAGPLMITFFFFFVLAMIPFLVIGILLGLIGALLAALITGRRWSWVCWVAIPIVGAAGACGLGYCFIFSVF